MLMIWSSRPRNRSLDPVVSCFFGRMLPSAAATESQLPIRGNPRNEIASFRGFEPQKLAFSNRRIGGKQTLAQGLTSCSRPTNSVEFGPKQCTLWFFHMERGHERSGQGLLGQCSKPIFVTSDQVATSKKAGQRERKHDGRQRVVKLKQRLTKDEAAKTEHDGADDAPRGIGHEKRAQRHAIEPGEEPRKHPQKRSEGAKEHNLGSVPQERVLSDVDRRQNHANPPAVSQQKCAAVS